MQKYSERLNDISILQLGTEGFENLTDKQKKLAMHLSNAGLWGRFISVDQGSEHNIPLFNALIEFYETTGKEHPLSKQLHDTLFTLFAHNGIYHSMSGERLNLPLNQEELLSYSSLNPQAVKTIDTICFSPDIAQFRTIQKDGIDVIKESGGNFYKNLTLDEVKNFRKENYPTINNDEVPPFGFNERIVKDEDGTIHREIISEDGLYSKYVGEIIKHLEMALEFAENDKQHESISTLITFYRTGSAVDFDKHCVAWTQDRDSHIYFINGLIESYEDPLGIGCTFESIVAFKNPLQTAKVNKIIDNIQWFENNMPFDNAFKKEKALGLSASSVNVISMAGETAPSIPLGINLPNSDWIRKKHGSKSVNLANVAAGRSTSEVQIREALFLKEYHGILEKYGIMTNNLHTDLHEIAGHGSGKTLEGVNTDDIGVYYSTIEEARADLVALYFMADEKLRDFGVYDSDVSVQDAAQAQYVSYLTNGSFGQLRRVELGKDLTQAHFRNRQLIANWVLEHADPSKVQLVKENNLTYVKVNDVQHAQKLFGQLLGLVQNIKSTANFEEAQNLVMTYGTSVNKELHAELLDRMESLNLPKTTGFLTPVLYEQGNNIHIEQPNSFMEQQLDFYKKYGFQSSLSKKNKNTM